MHKVQRMVKVEACVLFEISGETREEAEALAKMRKVLKKHAKEGATATITLKKLET